MPIKIIEHSVEQQISPQLFDSFLFLLFLLPHSFSNESFSLNYSSFEFLYYYLFEGKFIIFSLFYDILLF